MGQRLRSYLTYANVISTLCLFLVLGGGTAMAAYVVSSNIQVGPGTISGHHPPSGKHPNIVAGSVGSRDVTNDSLSGADVIESSLGQVPSAKLGGLGGDTGIGSCNPESSGGFITCVQTDTINLAAPTRVLIIGQALATPESLGSPGQGTCHVGSNIGALDESRALTRVTSAYDSISMSGVTGVVGPGPIKFGLDCAESEGGIEYHDAHLSYVELSPGSP